MSTGHELPVQLQAFAKQQRRGGGHGQQRSPAVFASGRAGPSLTAASLDVSKVLRAKAGNWARPVAITTAVGISSR